MEETNYPDTASEHPLGQYIAWLIEDQHPYGEFGKHEITNPTDCPRTLESSQIKPNIFSSIMAYSALLSVGSSNKGIQSLLDTWLEKIRSNSGYWTSASGKKLPFSTQSGWAESNNLRHTAKCLDYYFLISKFSYQDAEIFQHIINCQFENGAYPQFEGSQEDLWSTAYFVNLLIRALEEKNIAMVKPRGTSDTQYKVTLESKLNRSIEWILSKLNSNYFWHIDGSDDAIITIAMMIEIGGYLALHKAELCNLIVEALIHNAPNSASLIYVGCLTFDTLNSDTQAHILHNYDEILSKGYEKPVDLLSAISFCKLFFINKNIGILKYYRDLCNGHESGLAVAEPWKLSAYFQHNLKLIYDGKYTSRTNPIQESDLWEKIDQILNKIKLNIEHQRGWELFWSESKTSVKEERAQVILNHQFNAMASSNNIKVTREEETGHGPIDFSFSNGYSSKCILEIKLSTNPALKNGNCIAQIYTYAMGLGVSSAFLVIIGYSEKDRSLPQIVDKWIKEFKEIHDDFYIQVVYIDASQKISASNISLNDIK